MELSEFMQGCLVGSFFTGVTAVWCHWNFRRGVEEAVRHHFAQLEEELANRHEEA